MGGTPPPPSRQTTSVRVCVCGSALWVCLCGSDCVGLLAVGDHHLDEVRDEQPVDNEP